MSPLKPVACASGFLDGPEIKPWAFVLQGFFLPPLTVLGIRYVQGHLLCPGKTRGAGGQL